jgi:hypothetical protein
MFPRYIKTITLQYQQQSRVPEELLFFNGTSHFILHLTFSSLLQSIKYFDHSILQFCSIIYLYNTLVQRRFHHQLWFPPTTLPMIHLHITTNQLYYHSSTKHVCWELKKLCKDILIESQQWWWWWRWQWWQSRAPFSNREALLFRSLLLVFDLGLCHFV